jgi:hypothetical protein
MSAASIMVLQVLSVGTNIVPPDLPVYCVVIQGGCRLGYSLLCVTLMY